MIEAPWKLAAHFKLGAQVTWHDSFYQGQYDIDKETIVKKFQLIYLERIMKKRFGPNFSLCIDGYVLKAVPEIIKS